MTLIDSIIASVEQWLEQMRTASNHSDNQPSSIAVIEQAAQALRQRIAQVALCDLLDHCDTQIEQSTREISPGVERGVALLATHLSFVDA